MAITATNLLAEVNTVNTNPYTTTGTPTLHAGKLGLLAIMSQHTGGSVSPTSISGPGTTSWVEVGHVDFNTLATPLRRVTLYRACNAADQTGAITVTFAAAQSNCFVVLDEVSGTAATSANNGSDAFNTNLATNANDSTASPFDVILSALASTSNAGYAIMGSYHVTQAYTAGTGCTGLGTATGTGTSADSGVLFSEYGVNVTTMEATYASAQYNGGVAVELLVAAGGGGATGSGAFAPTLGAVIGAAGVETFIGSAALSASLGAVVAAIGVEQFVGTGALAPALAAVIAAAGTETFIATGALTPVLGPVMAATGINLSPHTGTGALAPTLGAVIAASGTGGTIVVSGGGSVIGVNLKDVERVRKWLERLRKKRGAPAAEIARLVAKVEELQAIISVREARIRDLETEVETLEALLAHIV